MTQIHTPVKGFTGTVAGVTFTDGVGETDNPTALAYFKRHAYTIGTEKQAPAPTPETPETGGNEDEEHDEATATVRPAGNASKQAWHDYALASGFDADELDGLDRNELRELVGD